MGDVAHGEHRHGEMDISDQKNTFSGFMTVTVWGSALVVMLVAALTVAFAMGAGWFAGVAVWAVLGVAAGLALNIGVFWWAMVIASTLVFAIGGGVAVLLASVV